MYLSSDEFLDLERARLTLRAHGIGADRGRLVREAIALLMTDLEAGIDASVIAKRLRAAGEPDPADGAPTAVGTANGAAAANRALAVNGAPAANGAPAVNGAPTVDGAPATNGAPAASGAPVGDDPVAGVLANGSRVTGPPEGSQ